MSNKLSPPQPLSPVCPDGYVRVHLTSEPEGKDAYRSEPREEMFFVKECDVAKFLELVREAGGLHYGFHNNNLYLRELMEEQDIVVLVPSWDEPSQLEVWEG